jgi:dTMP kinase
MAWMHGLAGRFIVFDGPDGSGKSTQFRRLADAVRASGIGVCEVREPGGTVIGEQIRSILLDPAHEEMDLRCEMLLYMASRAQLVTQTIRPALASGALVLADRFISSTLAYQGTAGGLCFSEIERVGEVAVGGTMPDLVVIFDVDERTASTRLNPLLDRIESRGESYHRRVREGYLQQARQHPQMYRVIDASREMDEVTELLFEALRAFCEAGTPH